MPWNGSGVFTSDPAGYPAVGGTTILASFYNAAMVDIASVGFGNCITRDGQGKPSAQIDWNAQNLTNVGALSLLGGISITGTGKRFTADFSNGTHLSRFLFQSSTGNGNTVVGAIPNGTSNISSYNVYNASDPTNASVGRFQMVGSLGEVRISAEITGTGTYLPITFQTTAIERARITAAGDFGIGTATPNYIGFGRALTLESTSVTLAPGFEFASNVTDADATGVGFSHYRFQSSAAAHRLVASIGVLTDGTTATQRGGAITLSTKPDAATATAEHMRINQYGSILFGVTAQTRTLITGGQRGMTLQGTTGQGVIQLQTGQADADGVSMGGYTWVDKNSVAAEKNAAAIFGLLQGATATNRGARIQFYTKADGASGLVNRMEINNAGKLGLGMSPTNFFDITSPTDDGIVMTDGTRTSFWKSFSSGPVGFGTSSAHSLVLYTNNQARFTIDSSGNFSAKGMSIVVGKTADTNRASNTTTANDPDLTVAIAGAGLFEFELFLRLACTNAVNGGFKFGMNTSGTYFTGSSSVAGISGFVNSVAITQFHNAVGATVASISATYSTLANSLTTDYLFIKGTLNSTGAGTFGLDWAQQSSSAVNSTVAAGSYLKVTRLF